MAYIGLPRDWRAEEMYWQDNYQQRPYVQAGQNYEFYRPGYLFGYKSADRYRAGTWDDVERDLHDEWERYEFRSLSTWSQIRPAVRDAWERVTGSR